MHGDYIVKLCVDNCMSGFSQEAARLAVAVMGLAQTCHYYYIS
jgi:hypothetical protein